MKVNGHDKVECIWCNKRLSDTSKNGTNPLKGHLIGCIKKRSRIETMTKDNYSLSKKETKSELELIIHKM
jgi:hypothetical protein